NAAGDAAIQKYIADNADEAKQFADIGDLKAANPKFAAFVLYDAKGDVRPEVTGLVPDKTHALLVATLTGNLSVDRQHAAADRLRNYVSAAGFTDVHTTVAGENLPLEDISNSLQDRIPRLGGLSVGLMILVVLFVFRARWKLLHLPVVAGALVIAFG